VKSDGTLGGYSRGVSEKIKLLQKEGIQIRDDRIIDFEKTLFRLVP